MHRGLHLLTVALHQHRFYPLGGGGSDDQLQESEGGLCLVDAEDEQETGCQDTHWTWGCEPGDALRTMVDERIDEHEQQDGSDAGLQQGFPADKGGEELVCLLPVSGKYNAQQLRCEGRAELLLTEDIGQAGHHDDFSQQKAQHLAYLRW